MPKLPWYPLYVHDFEVDTAQWDLDEIGLYLRLLNYQWANGPLPAEKSRLARIARIGPKRFDHLWKMVSTKFVKQPTPAGGGFINRKLEAVREEQIKAYEKQTDKARRAAQARWKGSTGSNARSNATSNACALHEECQSESETETTISHLSVTCPQRQIVDLYHTTLPTLPRVRAWTEKRATALRTRWREDEKRQTLEWWKKFFEYIKKCPHLIGENKRGWTADLEWIVKSENFIKILEGRYER